MGIGDDRRAWPNHRCRFRFLDQRRPRDGGSARCETTPCKDGDLNEPGGLMKVGHAALDQRTAGKRGDLIETQLRYRGRRTDAYAPRHHLHREHVETTAEPPLVVVVEGAPPKSGISSDLALPIQR